MKDQTRSGRMFKGDKQGLTVKSINGVLKMTKNIHKY